MKIEIDAEGLSCPEPIMLLHKAIRESSHGDLIELKATDKSTTPIIVVLNILPIS